MMMGFNKLKKMGFDTANSIFGKLRNVDEDLKTTVYSNEFKKSYDFYTIVSPEALDDFVKEKFIKKRPRIIGLDCEAGVDHDERRKEIEIYSFVRYPTPKVTVIQLATSEWLCLIDVQVLCKHLRTNWMKFFSNLLHQDTTIVGFAIDNDIRFIYARFGFLEKLLKRNQKMFCVSKLSDFIRSQKNISKYVFYEGQPYSKSMAALADAILEIEIDKRFQKMNWMKRPLSRGQKYYAAMDALIPLMIRDEIHYFLETDLNVDEALSIMKKGFLNMEMVQLF